MSKAAKDAISGTAKVEDGAGPAPTAPPGDQYEYYEEPEAGGLADTGTIGDRPLPEVPPPARPGQSRPHVLRGAETEGRGPNAQIPSHEARRAQDNLDSFILRNLPTFKGEYNGTAITDWVQKVDLLLRITGTKSDSIVALLPLRVDTQVVNFLEGLRGRLNPSQYDWERVKPALLQQYGGVVDPTKHVSRLHSARMERETPVRQFAQEVERLARLAYPELTSDLGTPEQRDVQKGILNRITFEQLVSGLPPMLSRPVVERQIENFDEAVDLAAHLEEVNARYFKKSTINAFFNTQDQPGSGETSGNRQEVSRSGEDTGPTNAAFRDNTPRRPPMTRRQEPVRAGGPAGSGRQQEQGPRRNTEGPWNRSRAPVVPERSTGTQRCYRCGETGHFIRECHLCYICGERHPTEACRNIVCACCKQAGHSANRCSKNSTRHPIRRPTS